MRSHYKLFFVLCASFFLAPSVSRAQSITLPALDLVLPGLDLDTILANLNPNVGAQILGSCVPVSQACLGIIGNVAQAVTSAPQAVSNTLASATLQTNQQIADFALSGVSVDAVILPSEVGAVLHSVSPVAESFGISGVSHMSHDGFVVSSAGLPDGRSPDFDSLDAGGTLGVRFDASQALNWPRDSLTIGLFGNYTNSEIDFNSNAALRDLGITSAGNASLNSGSGGGYALATNGQVYGMALGSGEFGSASVRDGVLDSHSDFDTSGFSSSLLGGIVFPAWTRTKVDLRTGLNYLTTTADNHIDTAGISFGDAHINEFSGTASARLFTTWIRGNTVLRPFVQGGVDYRFMYENEIRVDNVEYSLDEGRTTLFGRVGMDFDIADYVQAYLAFRADHNEDFDTVGGQLGLTVKLN